MKSQKLAKNKRRNQNSHSFVCAFTGNPIFSIQLRICVLYLKYAGMDQHNFLETCENLFSFLCYCVEPLDVSLAPSSAHQVENKRSRPSCSIFNHPPFNTKSRYNIYIHGLKGKNKVHVWGGMTSSDQALNTSVSQVCLFYILLIEIQGITYVIYVTHCQDFWTGPHIDFILA